MFTLKEILEATGGTLIAGKLSLGLTGVSTDTRLVKRGQIFVAIEGDSFDGHHFLAQAVEKGARAVVVSSAKVKIPAGVAGILVEDTVKALGRVARYHRQRFHIPVIAITGSAGKTSTKELMAAVMAKKYRVLLNKGTENNHIGVPMTLLKLTRRHQAAVIEMGTNHPGEIAWLAQNTLPTVAVFTNVGASHLEGLGTPQGVYEEKRSLLKYTSLDGHVIVNADDPFWARLLKKRLSQKVLSYGIKAKADVKAVAVTANTRGIHFKTKSGYLFTVKSPSWGAVQNALAAIAVGCIFRVPEVKVREALKKAKPAKGRQCLAVVGGVTLIDDTYNANPVSYQNALRTLSMLECRGRVVLVAADMLELGVFSDELHRQVGSEAAGVKLDAVFTCGKDARLIGQAAKNKNPVLDVRHFSDQAALTQALKKYLRSGDLLLCKGSRGMRMEKVVQDIRTFLKG
jgi:UDP-N-acetylmuramoyl-tripeptide--D-alanyl-D-alanine ligase